MIETILLGTAQDGGVPHAGSHCPTCAAAWADPALQQHPACLGLVDYDAHRDWLIDATPAFPAQLHAQQALAAGPEAKHFLGSTEIQACFWFARIACSTVLRYMVKRLASLNPARS